ncbi:poly(A)-binding protein binding protein [Basidiobolus ranarum]|uniref:Poly(A)-binding protein binding protein n=1 Tax=Basidiobolus ranarum TaxID=34480 RepID=A0ABR2W1E4_9FUNG
MEIDGRVAELLKFSQSFKLKTPMPAALIPILGKDKSKKSDADSKDEDVSEPQKEISKPKTVNLESVELVDEKETKAKPVPPPSESTKTTEPPTAAASVTPVPAAKPASTFKFNIKASEFKPNPTAAPFIPSSQQNTDKKPNTTAASSPFFGNKNMKRGHTSIKEMFKNPTTAEKSENPSTIAPTWPFGQKSFRHQFSHTTIYEEDGYGHNIMGQQYDPYVAYRYPVQFPGMPSMGMQQPPMQYMTSAPFVPNMQFSPAMAHPGGPSPAVYSPQMTPVSAPRMYQKGQAPPAEGQHFVPPNNFPPQGRGPMVPNMPPQMYAYPGPQGHVMVRYPTEMMPHVTGPPMMVPQRPAMDQPPMSPFISNEQPNEDLTNDPVTSNSTS